MPEISIIVPVYNVELYLRKCIDSILAQTFKDFELILVDDGSTDNSGNICDEYEQDIRVKVIHKANGGLSSARNCGIENATGKYFGFVDSDDYIDIDMYETLFDLIEKYKADIALCRLYDCYDGQIILKKLESKEYILTPEQTMKIVLDGKITSVTAVNKLYKRELFEHLRYPDGKTTEDAFLIIDILSICKKCVITTQAKYYYVHRKQNSITSLPLSSKSLDVIEAYKHVENIIVEKFPAVYNSAHTRLLWAHLYLIERMLLENSMNKELLSFLKNFIRKNKLFIIFNSKFSLKKKFSIFILFLPFIGNHLYRCLLKNFR